MCINMNQKYSFPSCLHSSRSQSEGGTTIRVRKPTLTLLLILHSLVLSAFIHAGSCSIAEAQGGDYTEYRGSPMDPIEEEAFYNVLYALNQELDWRALYPDPCGEGSPQGATCEEGDGLWHLTSLSFGPVYANTPPCGQNATIHASIAQLTHLKSLSFYRCFMYTSTSIPPEIGNLKASLQSLTLMDNAALMGAIPAMIGRLLNLERLIITGTKVEGGVPPQLGQLERLLQLDLSNNKLGGVIPASLGNLRSVVVMDLSRNCLSGSIPASFGELLAMEKMDLSRNMVGGMIPVEMGSLKALKLLDMSFNRLQGNIPSSFKGFSSLKELYLSSNSFNGVLPTEIWSSLHLLQSLDLSNAGFEGPIPPNFSSLHSLRYLSLANNRFTGPIPNGLGTLSHLSFLHLDGNKLSGQLPFTPAFVAHLGPNLLIYGNEDLCSMVPNLLQGMNSNVRVCSSTTNTGAQDAHQLTSTSTFLSHLTNMSPLPPRSFSNILLSFLVSIIGSFVF